MTTSISSNKVSKKPDVVLDPNFFLPPGVVDMRYTREEDPSVEDTDTTDSDGDATGDVIIIDNGTEEPSPQYQQLLPPDWLTIVSQTTRQTADGRTVIDVVIEVEDVPGSSEYDLKVSKQ